MCNVHTWATVSELKSQGSKGKDCWVSGHQRRPGFVFVCARHVCLGFLLSLIYRSEPQAGFIAAREKHRTWKEISIYLHLTWTSEFPKSWRVHLWTWNRNRGIYGWYLKWTKLNLKHKIMKEYEANWMEMRNSKGAGQNILCYYYYCKCYLWSLLQFMDGAG